MTRRSSALPVLLALCAAAAADTSPRLLGFSPRTASVVAQADAHRGRITALTFTADSRSVLTLGQDQSLKTWTSSLKSAGDAMDRQFRGDRIDVTPDGKFVIGTSVDGQSVLVVDRKKRETVATLGRSIAINKAFALSPDGKSVAMLLNTGQSRIYNVADGSEKVAFTGQQHGMGAMAWSRDGKMVGSVGLMRTGRIMDAATGEEIVQLEGNFTRASDLAFSPDGKTFCVADWGGVVRLFDTKTGKETLTLTQRQGGLKALAFSPDGKLIALGEATGGVKIFDAKTGKELRSIDDAHVAGVYAIAFSPDGRYLATGGGDGKVKIWGGGGAMVAAKPHKAGYLGITGSWDDTAKGVVIATIVAGGGADKAGLQAGDVIQAIDGKTFDDFDMMKAMVTSHVEGDTIEVKIDRGGNEQKIKVKLGQKPPE